jgi:hypothetical protein
MDVENDCYNRQNLTTKINKQSTQKIANDKWINYGSLQANFNGRIVSNERV